MDTFNFNITAQKPVSQAFLQHGISDFTAATDFMRHLPYRRNADKTNLLTVFSDHCGTCSTKHALLRELAAEHNKNEVQLILGIFKMNAVNTPAISKTLAAANLDYIPEAHNYLRIHGHILDCTWKHIPAGITDNLLTEMEIQPGQITDFKVSFHKAFLQQWLHDHPGVSLSLQELWTVREQCIADLSR